MLSKNNDSIGVHALLSCISPFRGEAVGTKGTSEVKAQVEGHPAGGWEMNEARGVGGGSACLGRTLSRWKQEEMAFQARMVRAERAS